MENPIISTQKITTFLWFNGQAEAAINFYTSVFKNARVLGLQRWGAEGQVMSGTFELEGQRFMALNGGPQYSFTPAISLFVNCESQAEVDELWDKLSAGGRKDRCGWLTDQFGLSWQIIPKVLGEMLHGAEADKSGRVMQAMLQMDKIDIETLKRAYAGENAIPSETAAV